MKESRLRKWHGRVGAFLAIFFILQALSGLVLGYGLARRQGLLRQFPDFLASPGWGDLLRLIHGGPSGFGFLYHALLGLGLVWMALSGAALFRRGHSRRAPPS